MSEPTLDDIAAVLDDPEVADIMMALRMAPPETGDTCVLEFAQKLIAAGHGGDVIHRVLTALQGERGVKSL